MARPRQPTKLVAMKGKKHLTKAEVAERLEKEVNAPADKVTPPPYLTAKQKGKFTKIARDLLAIEILANLDCDALARHIQSEEKYLRYDKMADRLLKLLDSQKGDFAASGLTMERLETMERMRDRVFRQCRATASDLGLTISSRCRLVVPKVEKKQDPHSAMFGEGTG